MGKLKEILSEQYAVTSPRSMDADWQALLMPEIDFFPGSALEACPKALYAVQKVVESAIHKSRPTAYVQWFGTHVSVFERGLTLGRTEIHGATWRRNTNEVSGVRVDLDFLKKKQIL